jgi:hypothetical protein
LSPSKTLKLGINAKKIIPALIITNPVLEGGEWTICSNDIVDGPGNETGMICSSLSVSPINITATANRAVIRNINSELMRGFFQTLMLEIDFVEIFAKWIFIQTS